MQVAIDVGPLHGRRTGIGNAVAALVDGLRERDDLDLLPYVVSTRARVRPPERRLPIPAALAHRLWAVGDRPRVDRWLPDADVVHGTNYVVPPSHRPRLVSVYDCWFLEHPDLADPAVRRAGQVLRRSVARGAEVVTSSAATSARVTELLGPRRVHTVHLGPPDPIEPPTATPPRLAELAAQPVVLALGTIERRKNLTTLVAAFDLVAASLPEPLLVIAGGDGDDSTALSTVIDRRAPGVRARIHRLGPVDEAEKAWLLHHASVLAYPSLDEGFGFPILEAQLAGTPVVAAEAGSIPEVGGDAVRLSDPDDVDGIAADLHLVLTDPAVAADLATRGRRNVTRFSWTDTAAAHVELYGRLAGVRR